MISKITLIILALILIGIFHLILKTKKMSQELEAIKADLEAAKVKTSKIAADVAGLHAKIDALGDAPTAEELAEVKQLSADLNTSLQAVDDATADADQGGENTGSGTV